MSATYGTMAQYRDAEALADAVEDARAAGLRRLEVYAPYPLAELARSLGWHPSVLGWITTAAGLVGGALTYGLQWWMNAVDYPINVGGRPLHAWPTFIPATLIVAILWAATATLLAMLVVLRLPRLHHPVFAVEGFERASQDRFFLLVLAADPAFRPAAVEALLARHGPERIVAVPA